MPRLNEVAKKVAVEAISTAAAPVVLTGDILKGAASRTLQSVNPMNRIRIPGMDILKMMSEMRNNLKSRLSKDNDNDSMNEVVKSEKKQTETLGDSLDILKDIRNTLKDLIEIIRLKDRREIREKKIQKYRNLKFDVDVDKTDKSHNKKFDWKGVSGKLRMLKNMWENIKKWILPVGLSLAMTFKRIRIAVLDINKALIRSLTNIVKMPENLSKGVKSVGRLFRRFSKGFTWFSRSFSNLSKFFEKLPMKNIIKSAGKFARIFKGLGRYVFMPLTMTLFGIYDFIDGFMKSYSKDGKIMKAVWEGMKNVIKGLVFMPLDLLKDIASWAAKKMGFDEVSKFLDSFSFEKMYDDFMKSVEDIVREGFEYAKNIYKKVKKKFSDIFGNLKKKILDKLPSWEDFKKTIQDKWQNLLNGIENIRKFIVDLWNNPSKAWEILKKKFPNMGKLIEEMKKKIPSFDDIKKSLTDFNLGDFFKGIKNSVKYMARSMLKSLPLGIGDKIINSIEWLKDPKVEASISNDDKDIKTDIKKLEVISKTHQFKEYTKEREIEKQFPKFPPIILQDNKKIIHQNSMSGPATSDPTPQGMVTTSYTSRWETN